MSKEGDSEDMLSKCAIGCSILLAACGAVAAVDPNPGPPGERPYEMANRTEEREPLLTFDQPDRFTIQASDNLQAALYRSDEQKLYRDFCGKLAWEAAAPHGEIRVNLNTPLAIPEPWDAVNFWNWGNAWQWAPSADNPPIASGVIVRDANGVEHELPMGTMGYCYWHLQHCKVTAAIARPAELTGLVFRNFQPGGPQRVYLGPLYFYQEELKPLSLAPWPEKLPFPLREETILPINLTDDYQTAVETDDGQLEFVYRDEADTLRYRWDTAQPLAQSLSVDFNGKQFRPMDGLAVELNGKEAQTKFLAFELRESDAGAPAVVKTRWQCTTGDTAAELDIELQIRQKSMIVTFRDNSEVPAVTRLKLGKASDLVKPELFYVPYFTYGGTPPKLLMDEGVFVLSSFDWYYSNASRLYGADLLEEHSAAYNGGALYIPKTDGSLNLLQERLFLTVSGNVEEVWPTIDNPPSPMREAQGDRLWRVRFGGNNHQQEIDQAAQLRSLGLEQVSIRYHEDSWRDGGESFTFRTDAAPAHGGDAPLKNMVSTIQSLGWRVGLYTNYTDFSPVNAYWNEDWVSREPDGSWTPAWPRCYAPKPMIAREMEARLAPQIQAKFGENHSYCDVHTAVSPADRVDYDARVPGAGTFRRTYECFGLLLLNEKIAHNGPVYSEGSNHWWYAGLVDGNYAQLNSSSPSNELWFPDFDLYKMHPLSMDAGMGAAAMFFRNPQDRDLKQFIAATLIYGHIGFLDGDDPAELMRIYYLLQPLQEHYVMVKVKSIRYADAEGRLFDTSEALANGCWKLNRLRVEYDNGFCVYANGGREPWKIRDWVTLPQWGFFASTADRQTMSMSIAGSLLLPDERFVSDRDFEMSIGPNSCYFNAPDGLVYVKNIAAIDGTAALKLEKDHWELIPGPSFREFGFAPHLLKSGNRKLQIVALGGDGRQLAPVETRFSRGLWWITPQPEAVKYIIVPAEGSFPAEKETADWCYPIRDDENLLPGVHIWRDGRDYLTVQPAAANLKLNSYDPFSRKAEITLQLLNFSDRQLTGRLAFSGDGTVESAAPAVELAPGKRLQRTLQWFLADREGPQHLQVQLAGSGKAAGSLEVTGRYEPLLVADLLDASRPYRKGFRTRQGKENYHFEQGTDGDVSFLASGVSGGQAKPALFMHPPWGAAQAGYVFYEIPVQLPDYPAELTGATGFRDGLNATDGGVFDVFVTTADGERENVFHHPQDAVEFQDFSVDLSRYAGRQITLRLQFDCGPANDTSADHAFWGEPKIVGRQQLLKLQ